MAVDNKNNHEKVRKFLKKLSSVKASDDFELRLKRRILSIQTDNERKFKFKISGIFSTYPLPAYSMSLLTIIAVGLISYYAFIRTGITPTSTISTSQDISKMEPEALTELPGEIKEVPEKNAVLHDKVSSKVKQSFRTAPPDLGGKKSEQTQLPSAAEQVTQSESAVSEKSTEKADGRSENATQLIEQNKSGAKLLSVPLSKQRVALIQAQHEQERLTFIDSTSRTDTSKMDSLKKYKR